jgi:hypothetical protein
MLGFEVGKTYMIKNNYFPEKMPRVYKFVHSASFNSFEFELVNCVHNLLVFQTETVYSSKLIIYKWMIDNSNVIVNEYNESNDSDDIMH